jgi:glycosyltransferase involved in cell wall biosynthesis
MRSRTYRGRIHQCIESLDYGDACSNQVLELHKLLLEAGYDAHAYAEFVHTARDIVKHLSELEVHDDDIVICHYSGYSANVIPYISELRCTRIILYHNITPHEFFAEGSDQYIYCKKGRKQLPEILPLFHYYWAVSNYNLSELQDLGADPRMCALVPLVLNPPCSNSGAGASSEPDPEPGSWLFVGRIAPNKGHLELLEAFGETMARAPHAARRLYLVGNPESDRVYYQQVLGRIKELGLQEHVALPGKVKDCELEAYFRRSTLYVSMSRHEGFGAPLIEAVHRDLPVLALTSSGVSETLGAETSLFRRPADLSDLAIKTTVDPDFREALLRQQRFNALRFTSAKISHMLQRALEQVIPSEHHFERVSIVICTRNRADLLDRTLDYLQFQTNPNFEVVVVDGSSTDHTQEVLRKRRHCIKTGSVSEANLSKSRNEGIALAAGDIVSFIDDDSIPFDDFVETLLAEFNRRPLTTAGLGGPVYFRGTLAFQSEDTAINDRAEIAEYRSPCWSDSWQNVRLASIGRDGWERSLLGTNANYRADLLRANGGFDEQFDYFLDESELSFRLQKRNFLVVYCPELFVRHEFAQSSNRLSKYNFNWYSICKNTAYFVAAYSGLKGEELLSYLSSRLQKERKTGLDEGLANGDLTAQQHKEMCAQIDDGLKQGLLDAAHHPKTKVFTKDAPSFLPYHRRTNFPHISPTLKPLHVCIVSKELQPFTTAGGNGTQFYHLTCELLLMGHRVTAIVPGDTKRTYRQGRLTVEFCPRQEISNEESAFHVNINWNLTALAAAAEIHREHPIDVIESTLWDSEALAFAMLPRDQRPVIVVRLVTPYAMAAEINRWTPSQLEYERFNAAEKELIANADIVMPISDCIAETIGRIHHIAPDRRWSKSYCGIAPWPSFDPWENYSDLTHIGGKPVAFSQSHKIILFVGRLESRKGVDLLLEAAARVLPKHPDAVLVLAGQDVEGLERFADENFSTEIRQRVYFLGSVDNNTRDKLLHAAYCLVFPSRYESFGFVPVEAFVHGCPVVAMRAGAIPEVVSHEHAGLLFDDGDSEGLAACLDRLLSDPALRARLVEGTRERRRMFSARRMAIDAVRAYHHCKTVREAAKKPKSVDRVMGSDRSYPISFSGNSPRLHTACGLKQEKQIVSAGETGTLLYGPYLDLEPGDYLATVFGRLNHAGQTPATVSVTAKAGAEQLATAKLEKAHGGLGELISLPFSVATPSQIEVVIQLESADTELAVTRLAVASSMDAPQSLRNRNKKVAFYTGSSTTLFTAVGKREGNIIRSLGQEGHLIYGPYLKLPAGNYRADIEGTLALESLHAVSAEVVSSSGCCLAGCEIPRMAELKNNTPLMSLNFSLHGSETIEVRLRVTKHTLFTFSSLTISSAEPFS